MRRAIFFLLFFLAVSTTMDAAQPVFEFNAGQGSLRDWATGTIPTNTGVVIKNTEMGRAAYFNGSAYLEYPPSFPLNSDFSVVMTVKLDVDLSLDTFSILSQCTASGVLHGLTLYFNNMTRTPNIVISAGNGVVVAGASTAFTYILGYNQFVLDYTQSTQAINLYLNNSTIATGIDGSKLDFPTGVSLFLGKYASDVTWRSFMGFMQEIKIYNTVLTAAERAAERAEFLSAKTQMEQPHKNKAIVEGSANSDVLFYDSGLDWNADGVTQSAFVDGYRIGGGTFRVKEDATGKYIECVTNGTILYDGIDLSAPVGNGFIRKLTGDLSGDQGGTISAASAVSWASNTITITMTSGQKYRTMAITRGN